MTYDNYWKYIEKPKREIRYFFKKLFHIKADNFKSIKIWINKHRNEIVLDDFGISLLLGFVEGEEDYYYVLYTQKGISLLSCTGQPYVLKHKLSTWDYLRLENMCKLNGITIEKGLELFKELDYDLL